jgi:hypothetical protein
MMRASMLPLMASVLAFGLPAALHAATATDTVGGVEAVKQDAYGTPPNAARAAKRKGDDVAFNELLETLQKSGMQVRFSDGSALTLGASSKVLVDAFVYDPSNPASKALMSIPSGTLRYVTGKMPKGQTTIDTPTATMVLRGTNVTVNVDDTGKTELYVKEGKVSVHNKITGQDTLVEEGNGVDIDQAGITVSDNTETGDGVVDDGIDSQKKTDNPEQRRSGTRNTQPSRSKPSNNGGSSGGSNPG